MRIDIIDSVNKYVERTIYSYNIVDLVECSNVFGMDIVLPYFVAQHAFGYTQIFRGFSLFTAGLF